jgi:hypothetical protein
MYRSMTVLLVTLALPGCRFSQNHFLRLPDSAKPEYASGEQRVPKSKLFIRAPDDYFSHNDSGIFRKDTATYIWVHRPVDQDFYEVTPKIDRILRNTHFDPVAGPNYDHQKMNISGCEAYFWYGVDSVPGRERIELFEGNGDFWMKADAIFPTGNARARDTAINTLMSLYYKVDDPYFDPDSMKFTLDLAGTGWFYDSNVTNSFYYTPSGRSHPARYIAEDQFSVTLYPPGQLAITPRSMYLVMHSFENKDFNFAPYHIVPTRVGLLAGYEVETPGIFKGAANHFYALLVGTDDRPVLVAGWTYDERALDVKSVKVVAHSLLLK